MTIAAPQRVDTIQDGFGSRADQTANRAYAIERQKYPKSRRTFNHLQQMLYFPHGQGHNQHKARPDHYDAWRHGGHLRSFDTIDERFNKIERDMATKDQIIALHTQVSSIETDIRGMKHTKLHARVADLEEKVFGAARD